MPDHGILVCKSYGIGIYPKPGALRRHLHTDGHFYKGGTLKEAVEPLCKLPLKSRDSIRQSHLRLYLQLVRVVLLLTVILG